MNVSVKKNKKQVAIAMMITMLLLAGSFIFAQAAPVAQDTVATMSLPMAIIIGLMYYITQSPFLANLGLHRLLSAFDRRYPGWPRHGPSCGRYCHRREHQRSVPRLDFSRRFIAR